MSHSSQSRWENAAQAVSTQCAQLLRALVDSEEVYQDFIEVYNFAGASDQAFADLLFRDQIPPTGSPETRVANSEQIDCARDLRLAIEAMHELYQAANNTVIAQEDRASVLRRMS